MNNDKSHYSNFSNFESHLYNFNMVQKATAISSEVKNTLRKTFVRWCTELVLENEFDEFEKIFKEWSKYDVEIVNDFTIVGLFWGVIKPKQATSSSEIIMEIDDYMGIPTPQSDVEMADRSRITGLLWGSTKSEQATSFSETVRQSDDHIGVSTPQSDVNKADHSKSPAEIGRYFTEYDAAFFEKFLSANHTNRTIIYEMRDPFISWCKAALAKGQDEAMNTMLDTWIKYDPSIENDRRLQTMWGM